MKLSIIIPYFNTPAYTDELLAVLDKQITYEVEVILIDDGSKEAYRPSFPWLKIIRTQNGGQSRARNKGLSLAKGDYIQFIDSDDMVPEYFIEKLLSKVGEGRDIIEYSWRSLNTNGALFNYKVSKDGDRLSNPSACTRCFKRSYIGDVRFSELKDATEDEDFSRRLGYLYKPVSVSIIPDFMYFYRTDVSGSNVKKYKNGLCKTKRIVYYFEHVESDRTDILESIKKDDETNEVFLLTNQNDMPELKRWCQILPPLNIWTHYLKGEPYRGCSIVPIPISSEIIVFIRNLHIIGGIESFLYNFSWLMQDHELTLVVDRIYPEQEQKLKEYMKVVHYDPAKIYFCKTLIMERILDDVPPNINHDQVIRQCHACKTNPTWQIPKGDYIVNVSQTSKDSFKSDGIVIHNPIKPNKRKALYLISATRVPAPDKGHNEERMRQLAEMLIKAEIPFTWLNFSEGAFPDPPQGLLNMGYRMNMMPYIAKADYLVQLSDSEAWSYSVLEALTQNVPVIVTPFPSGSEMGIVDGKTGYVVPFDMNFDVNKLLKIPKFKYPYSNEEIKAKWEELLKGGKS